MSADAVLTSVSLLPIPVAAVISIDEADNSPAPFIWPGADRMMLAVPASTEPVNIISPLLVVNWTGLSLLSRLPAAMVKLPPVSLTMILPVVIPTRSRFDRLVLLIYKSFWILSEKLIADAAVSKGLPALPIPILF